jgi:ribonucleoside-triphosphate reductase
MVPFELPISLSDKIAVEAPFHKLANGGHIFYYKIDGDAAKNVEAVRAAITAMHKGNLGYYCCTFDQDTCRECGYRGIIHDKCPKCGGTNILRIRRITGYLVGRSSQSIEESWCNGKRNELKHRGNI